MRRHLAILAIAAFVVVACESGGGGGGGYWPQGGHDTGPSVAPDPGGAAFDPGPAGFDPGSATGSDIPAALDAPPPPRDLPNYDALPGPLDVAVKDQPIGGLCTDGSACKSGFCVSHAPGGYCSLLCSDAPCPAGTSCYPGIGNGPKMCYRDCAGNGDCRGDQFCGNKICVPRCRPGDCQPSYRCDAQSGRCVYSPEVCMPSEEVCNEIDDDCDDITDEGCSLSTVLPEGVGRIDLGTVGVGGGGVSRDISFHIPQTVGSFTLVALTGDASYIGLWSLSAPDGTALVDATDPFSSPNPVIPQEGALTALVSNAPARFTVIPGTYRATLLKDGDWMRVPVSVLTRAHDQGGRLVLDVNYYFVGTPGITASNYQSNSKFGSVLSTFWQVMKRADIYPGIVQAFDITGSDAQKYTYLDMSLTGKGELPDLLALSGNNPDNGGLNYFFVQDIANYGALGVAGGIPGPPLFQGTASSGVAVSMASFYHYTGSYAQYGVADTAEAMAHETGHYMGLFHLSEKDGNTHDPLTDTPECSNDVNGDGMVGPDECVGRGAENLMFWSVTGAVAISGQQRQVIRGFPQNHP